MYSYLKRNTFPLVAIIFIGLPLFANLRGLEHNCFNITDFGILQEAIYKMPFELNPWLTVRGMRAWSDHFDPITWAAAPGSILANFNPQFLIFWEWLFWGLGALFIAITPTPSQKQKMWGLLAWIFSRPLLEALLYPIHPNTWAMLPLLILAHAIITSRWRRLYGLALLLPLYREIYPFCFATLALALLLDKKTRPQGLRLLIISTVWLLIIFILRPLIAGPVQNYGGILLGHLLGHPLQGLLYVLDIQQPMAMLKLFIPLLIPLLLTQKLSLRPGQPFFLASAFLAPYFAAHFLAGQFMHHYGVPFACFGIALLAFNQWTPIKGLRLGVLFGLVIFPFASGPFTKFFEMAFFHHTKRCELTCDHSRATDEVLRTLMNVNGKTKILASGGIIPQLIRPDRQVFHLYSWIPTEESYDVMVFERHQTGAHHPLVAEEIETLFQQCSPYASSVPIDNTYYFVMFGSFPKSCMALAGRSDVRP